MTSNHKRKQKTSLPAAMAACWLPFTEKLMGEAVMLWPIWKCQRGAPVLASTASNDSASSPKKTRPPAVVIVPLLDRPEPTCGYFQAGLEVERSYASRIFLPVSPGLRFAPVA